MPVIGLPRRRTSPAVGCRNPANMLISVVLPQPEAPMRQTNSPSLTSSERSRRATMLFPPAVNTLVTRSATRTLEKARLVTLASLAWVASIHHLSETTCWPPPPAPTLHYTVRTAIPLGGLFRLGDPAACRAKTHWSSSREQSRGLSQ